MNIETLPVVEIFDSIQGEGARSGTYCSFIRLAGCNLKCDFCDTDYTGGEHLSFDQIIEKINFKNVVITGGEPTIHPNLANFLVRLSSKGFYIAVETNGTNKISSFVSWVTVSPKNSDLQVHAGDEIKVLWIKGDKETEEEFVDQFSDLIGFKYKFIQPVEKKGKFQKVPEIIDFIKRRPQWRLCIQIHKVLHLK
jgi:organic radical activating enzyme